MENMHTDPVDPVQILNGAFVEIKETIAKALDCHIGEFDDKTLELIDCKIEMIDVPVGWQIKSFSRRSKWWELRLGPWGTIKEMAYYYFCFGLVPDLRSTIVQSEVTVMPKFNYTAATCVISIGPRTENGE
jgi:hypothetical protein